MQPIQCPCDKFNPVSCWKSCDAVSNDWFFKEVKDGIMKPDKTNDVVVNAVLTLKEHCLNNEYKSIADVPPAGECVDCPFGSNPKNCKISGLVTMDMSCFK